MERWVEKWDEPQWNDDWRYDRDEVSEEIIDRLGDCKNKPMDVVVMASAMWQYNPHRTKEECFERTMTWVGDWNNQYKMTDEMESSYNWYLSRVH